MNIKEAKTIIDSFIIDYIERCNSNGVVIGLSGGLDSSVTAKLCVDTLGTDKVDLISLVYRMSSSKSLDDARAIADFLNCNLEVYDISAPADKIIEARGEMDCVRRGNILARIRMIYLYDISSQRGKLVAGTGNRTERILGYSTLWGDMACAFTPIGDLLKTQERELARIIGLPNWIVEKTPSADLWPGQTDEDELGITYEMADQIIHHHFDLNKPREKLIENFPEKLVDLILHKYLSTEFKRRMPVYPKLLDLEF